MLQSPSFPPVTLTYKQKKQLYSGGQINVVFLSHHKKEQQSSVVQTARAPRHTDSALFNRRLTHSFFLSSYSASPIYLVKPVLSRTTSHAVVFRRIDIGICPCMETSKVGCIASLWLWKEPTCLAAPYKMARTHSAAAFKQLIALESTFTSSLTPPLSWSYYFSAYMFPQ